MIQENASGDFRNGQLGHGFEDRSGAAPVHAVRRGTAFGRGLAGFAAVRGRRGAYALGTLAETEEVPV